MELFKASNQWATRPADERFWDLQEMHDACKSYRRQAATSTVRYSDLRVEADTGDIRLVGKTGVPAQLTHYAFGQLCQRVSAPASYLRNLPATLAAQNLNHGLKSRRDENDEAHLLWHQNGGFLLRAALTERYKRIWNYEVCERLLPLSADGWRAPPARPSGRADSRARPATEADLLDRRGFLSVNVGDMIAPAGLYASDHDMFAFLVNEERRIEDGSDDGLARGFFVWNSEVGDSSFGMMTFLYKHVCGNHIVWDAQGVKEIRIPHVGAARAKSWRQVQATVRTYSDASVSDVEAKIKEAQTKELGGTKDEVLDALFGLARKKRVPLPRKTLDAAYDRADERSSEYGSPRSLWGIVNGLTEISQETEYADRRVDIDRAAGKLMTVAF